MIKRRIIEKKQVKYFCLRKISHNVSNLFLLLFISTPLWGEAPCPVHSSVNLLSKGDARLPIAIGPAGMKSLMIVFSIVIFLISLCSGVMKKQILKSIMVGILFVLLMLAL